MNALHVETFMASRQATLAAQFQAGRNEALMRHGCSAAAAVAALPGIRSHYVTLLDPTTGRLAGGVSLAIKESPTASFAVENILRSLGMIKPGAFLEADWGGVGELSSLWLDEACGGRKLSHLLLRRAIQLAQQLKLDTLVTLSSPHMIAGCIEQGFAIDETFGEAGLFPYPSVRYLSAVMRQRLV